MKLPKILIVDDSKINRHFFIVLLGEIYQFIEADSGLEGLEKCGEEQPDLILLDIAMPEMDGFEVYRHLLGNPETCGIPVIFITSNDQKKTELVGLEMGAVEFIKKSTNPVIIKKRIATHLELARRKRLLTDNQAMLKEEVDRKTKDLQVAQSEIVSRLGTALEFRSVYIGSHMKGLVPYCRALGEAYGFDKERCDLLADASRLHDIGMIGLSDSILDEGMNRGLDEVKAIRKHTLIGGKVLARGRSKLLKNARLVAEAHHERWDGKGYPRGLKGEDIPVNARITAIADTFESKTAEHPYCKTIPVEEVVEGIKRERGGAFDPALVDLFLENLDRFKEILRSDGEEEEE